MQRGAARVLQLAEGLTYLEDPATHRAFVVDTAAYQGARTQEERRRAVVQEVTIPSPDRAEVAAAAHTLHYAGVGPAEYPQIHLASVVAPGPASDEDLAFYRRALRDPNLQLTPAQRALYAGQLRLAGQL